jgi:hypothetical protein
MLKCPCIWKTNVGLLLWKYMILFFLICKYESWFVTVREEYGLAVF